MIYKISPKFLILTLFCFITFSSFSQNFEWLNYTTNNQSEIIKDMVVDVNENVIQLIQTKPKIQSQLANPFRIRKINSSGVEIWVRTLTLQDAVSIDTDSNGNIFLLGCSNGTTDLNPDPLIENSFFSNNSGAGLGNNEALFVLKLNSLGIFQNFATIGAYPNCNGSNGCFIKSYPLQLRIDYNDNVLFTFKPRRGGFIDIDPSTNVQNIATTSSNYFTMIKWSNNLDSLLWVNYLTGYQEEVEYFNAIDVTPKAISFDIDLNNNVYVATTSFPYIVFSKYSSNGTLLNNPANTKITSYRNIILSDISVLSNNEIVFGGQFINYIDVNPITANPSQIINSTYPITSSNGQNLNDAFIVQYDSNFNVIWKQNISSSGFEEIEDIESYNGKIYVLGTGGGATSGIPWTYLNSFLKILNSNGTLYREKVYISPYPQNAYSSSGVLDAFGTPFKTVYYSTNNNIGVLDWSKRNIALKNQKIFISGEYSASGVSPQNLTPLYQSLSYFGGFDWDVCSVIPPSHQAGINTIPINWLIRPYTAKYNLLECSNLSNENVYNLDKNILIYPNPTNSKVFFDNSNSNFKEVSIYNYLGQEVIKTSFNSSIQNQEIDMSNLATGIYVLKFNSGELSKSVKVIKQ